MTLDAEAVANNAMVRMTARLSMIAMPFILTVLVWFASQWLDQRFDVQKTATDTVSSRVTDLSGSVFELGRNATLLASRVTVLETGTTRGRQDREDFQDQITLDMHDVRTALTALSNNVAALTATVKILTERQAMDTPRDRQP